MWGDQRALIEEELERFVEISLIAKVQILLTRVNISELYKRREEGGMKETIKDGKEDGLETQWHEERAEDE